MPPENDAQDGAVDRGFGKSPSGKTASEESAPKVKRADTTISGRLAEMIALEARRIAGQIERQEIKGASNIEGHLTGAFAAIANHAVSEEVGERETQETAKRADFTTSLGKAIEIGRTQGMSGEQIKSELAATAQNL